MIHTKSNMQGLVKDYQKMYEVIKNWDESPLNCNSTDCYLYGMGYALDDMGFHGWSGDAAKNEIRHYKEVKKAYKSLMFALEAALGMEQESNFERQIYGNEIYD